MPTKRSLIAAALLGLPSVALAHGPSRGPNGGQMQGLGGYHGELLAQDGRLTFFLYDANDRPLSANGAAATAIVLAGGRQQTLAFAPRPDGAALVASGDFRAEPRRAVLPLRRIAAKRAVSNLVDNALRHGRPPVRLRIRDEGPMLAVEVSDAGAGIAEADRARAMAPFVQLDPARSGSGVGLGLAIAQRFAQASNGSLELRGSREGGLLARLLLPRQAG